MAARLRSSWRFLGGFLVFFALPASATLLYPTQGFFSDPWDTQALVPPLGQYRAVPGPHLQIGCVKPPPPAVLKRLRTLPALTAWALAHNPQTASAWADLEAQAAALGYAKGLWLPSISAQVQGQRSETLYSTSLLNAPP
jgi:Outer membrane protein